MNGKYRKSYRQDNMKYRNVEKLNYFIDMDQALISMIEKCQIIFCYVQKINFLYFK